MHLRRFTKLASAMASATFFATGLAHGQEVLLANAETQSRPDFRFSPASVAGVNGEENLSFGLVDGKESLSERSVDGKESLSRTRVRVSRSPGATADRRRSAASNTHFA